MPDIIQSHAHWKDCANFRMVCSLACYCVCSLLFAFGLNVNLNTLCSTSMFFFAWSCATVASNAISLHGALTHTIGKAFRETRSVTTHYCMLCVIPSCASLLQAPLVLKCFVILGQTHTYICANTCFHTSVNRFSKTCPCSEF